MSAQHERYPRAELILEWANTLKSVRTTAPGFAPIVVAPVVDEDGMTSDENRLCRAKCLWALQYSRLKDDDRLVRALFESETAWHRMAPFQGLADELRLAATLLAHDPPEDTLDLMWQAKTANFDTWCGLDSRFLGVGGVDDAISDAQAMLPVDDNLMDHLMDGEDARFSDAEVAVYLDEMSTAFPGTPEAEAPFRWFDRAQKCGETVLAKLLLDEWCENDAPPDSSLQRYLASIGHYQEAVDVQRRVVTMPTDGLMTTHNMIRLAELERLAGSYGDALTTLRRATEALARLSRPPAGNTLRRLAEEGFLLCLVADDPTATRAFKFADSIADSLGGPPNSDPLPLIVLRSARDAARKIGKKRRARHYEKRAEIERARIGHPTDE